MPCLSILAVILSNSAWSDSDSDSACFIQDDAVKKSYQAWLQGASVADATSEIEVLKAEAASLLDKHLAKTADEASDKRPYPMFSLIYDVPWCMLGVTSLFSNLYVTSQVRKDQESSLASLLKKLDSAKGSKWAEKFQQDLKNIAWFDAAVAASPVAGPKATA